MSTQKARFTGTDNWRHFRALRALMSGPVHRKRLDDAVGCANGPDLIAELRRRGLEIPCERVETKDRDGVTVFPGIYSLTAQDRRLIVDWILGRPELERAIAPAVNGGIR